MLLEVLSSFKNFFSHSCVIVSFTRVKPLFWVHFSGNECRVVCCCCRATSLLSSVSFFSIFAFTWNSNADFFCRIFIRIHFVEFLYDLVVQRFCHYKIVLPGFIFKPHFTFKILCWHSSIQFLFDGKRFLLIVKASKSVGTGSFFSIFRQSFHQLRIWRGRSLYRFRVTADF